MTRINKIVMHGFKSFAKHTEILFDSNFNCVLGPNGSGKSNVLDALCFVLGKSSAKSMRAEKSSNLIYNGGKLKKPSGHGEVSIYFDNSSKKFPTDDSEVKLTRVVKQNGQSIYKINDKARTRQQVLDLLSVAKIDPDGYNIILQGDIVRFVEMHPIERRALIEEISGISIYEEKKQKALRELEKVENRLKEAEIILSERSVYLKELKKDRDHALKFKGMSEKIRVNRASLLNLQIDSKKKEMDDLQEKLKEGNDELKKINDKIGKLKKDNDDKRKEIEDITKEIEEKGEIEQVKLNKEVENLKIEITKNTSRIETCKNELGKINKRRQDIKSALDEVNSKFEELNKEKNNLKKQKEAQIKEKELISSKIQKFKEKNKLDNIADIEKNTEEIDKKSEELQKEINELRENQHNLIREKDKILHQIGTIDEKIKKVAEIEKAYKSQIEDLKKKRDDFKKSTLELNKRLNEDSSLAAQLADEEKKLGNVQEELARLRAKNIGIKEIASGDIAVREILSRKGSISGIYGTLAELGNVDTKYSLALEVAAGPRIKSIVVEDDKVAADCIKYLKQNKLGTATFLPINKIKSASTTPEIKALANAKGCYGLAIDLIEFGAKFNKIFSYVFANTLVVDNIDVARRLGIGKAKMVTLDGDLAELSGVMQGGYRERKKHGFGFNQTEITSNIKKYEKIAADLENVIDILKKRRRENEEEIINLRTKKANLEGEIIKMEKSLHLEAGDVSVSLQQKEGLGKEAGKVDKQINDLQLQISEKNKGLASIKTEKQNLKEAISKIRSPVLIAELNAFNEKLRGLDEEAIKIDSEIRNIDNQTVTVYTPEKEKTLQILKQIDKEEEEFKKELSGLIEKVKKQEIILKKKEDAVKEFYSQFKILFEKRSKINDEAQKNEDTIDSRLEESRKTEIKNNTLSLKNAEVSASLAGLRQEFQQFEGVKIDTSKTEEQLKSEITKFEKLKDEIGSVNMRALEIYEEVEKEFNSLLDRKEKLIKEKDDVLAMMREIEDKKKGLFMKNFEIINTNFNRIFEQISIKGTSHLELENQENPFEGGLNIKVRITGNKFLDIRSLSGGEKTLTALAFIFAIQEHEPASFYILDEVDASLDKHNSERFAKLVKKYSEKAQYIIISHNDGVITESDNLYGVSMNEYGISQVVSLKA